MPCEYLPCMKPQPLSELNCRWSESLVEPFQFCFDFVVGRLGEVYFGFDLLEADFFVGFILVAGFILHLSVVLDFLTGISDFDQSDGGGRAFEEVAEFGEIVEIFLLPAQESISLLISVLDQFRQRNDVENSEG